MSQPRGIRNNNPGNLRKSNDPWQGLAANQTDSEFFTFVTPAFGIRAIARVLITYYDKHGLTTVRGIIDRWAPPVENNTESYIQSVARQVGISANDYINLHNYGILRAIVIAIIRHENGIQPYADAQIDKGLLMAGVMPPEKPIVQSRTIQGAGITAAAGTITTLTATTSQVRESVTSWGEWTPWIIALVALAGLGYMVWARIDDRRRGLR